MSNPILSSVNFRELLPENLHPNMLTSLDERIHVKIQDKDNQVYQVPESVFPRPDESESSADNSDLKFDIVEEPFSFKISRKETEEVLFDTSAASLIFESQYLRLRTSLPEDPYLYGLGEHSDPLRLKTQNYVRTMWNQDSFGIPRDANLYGTQPFYMEHRESGSHGVFLLNSNGLDVMINSDEDGQYLEYNTLGGVFDFWFFSGPSPSDVTRQYAQVAGLPTFQPVRVLIKLSALAGLTASCSIGVSASISADTVTGMRSRWLKPFTTTAKPASRSRPCGPISTTWTAVSSSPLTRSVIQLRSFVRLSLTSMRTNSITLSWSTLPRDIKTTTLLWTVLSRTMSFFSVRTVPPSLVWSGLA